ncbi:MAG TPA: ABC transporter permease [Spirochaetia bacterium]|nr:ABC transporter permease [Spirochaetia bacterium]
MGPYIVRRLLYMAVIILAVSVVGFIIIQLPPGDYVTSYIQRLASSGTSLTVSTELVESMRQSFGLDKPIYAQYGLWMWRILHGDFGYSLDWKRPVNQILAERVPLTIIISLLSTLFVYLIAIPIGIYSATHQYSVLDYVFTVVGFAGIAIPNFILALVIMVLALKIFGMSIGGLFSIEFMTQGWSVAKVVDMLKHLPVPIIVIGLAGTGGLIRVMRGCLLDELRKQYVVTARAKGLSEQNLLFKYPVRVAVSPIISTIGWLLPGIFAGETITAIVLNMPTVGPVLFQALMAKDMFLAGSIVVILTCLTVVGTFLSDVLLVLVDPRIRFTRGA